MKKGRGERVEGTNERTKEENVWGKEEEEKDIENMGKKDRVTKNDVRIWRRQKERLWRKTGSCRSKKKR